MSSGEKKAASIFVIVAVLFVAVVGTSVFLLVRGSSHDESGYLQVAIGDDLIRVEPTVWCDLQVRDCVRDDEPQHAPLPIGQSAVLSVSANIAEHPWVLYTVYADADGRPLSADPEVSYQASGSVYTRVLRSTPDRVLLNIEVQPLSIVSEGEDTVARGVLALDTTPDGFAVATEVAE